MRTCACVVVDADALSRLVSKLVLASLVHRWSPPSVPNIRTSASDKATAWYVRVNEVLNDWHFANLFSPPPASLPSPPPFLPLLPSPSPAFSLLQTETSTIISLLDASMPGGFPGESAGMLVPNIEAKIVSPEGKALPPGEIGELWSRGPSNMLGCAFNLPRCAVERAKESDLTFLTSPLPCSASFLSPVPAASTRDLRIVHTFRIARRSDLDNEKATRETLDSEGFVHTGDEGYITKDGLLVIVDRIKELIKVSGFQVAPAELEGHLLGHEDVQDCCVIGIPDEKRGEAPKGESRSLPLASRTASTVEGLTDSTARSLHHPHARRPIAPQVRRRGQDRFEHQEVGDGSQDQVQGARRGRVHRRYSEEPERQAAPQGLCVPSLVRVFKSLERIWQCAATYRYLHKRRRRLGGHPSSKR